MKKGTKIPVTYKGRTVGEAVVQDRDNGSLGVTITDPSMTALIESKVIEGIAYRPIHGALECVPRFGPAVLTNIQKIDKKETRNEP